MEERELVRAVMEHPDDDAPRLVYADWLLDRGDPRGEFIVLQCRLAALPAGDATRPAIARRADELLELHRRDWYPDAGGAVLGYRRGFPWMATADIADDPLALLDRVPLRTLRLVSRSTRERLELAHRIACDPRAARLHRLELEVDWGERGILLLLAGEHWGGLRELAIRGDDCRTTTLRTLGECNLTGLHSLELDGMGTGVLTGGGVPHLAAPGLGRLRRLALRNVSLRYAAAQTLAGASYLTELVELDLSTTENAGRYDNRIEGIGTRELARSRNFRELRRLILDGNRIGNRGLAELANSGALPALQELRVRRNDIDDVGLRALAAGTGAPELTRLDLANNVRISPGGIAEFVASDRFAWLRVLDLGRCQIGVSGTRALADQPRPSDLRDLDLSSSGIDSAGALVIAKSTALAGLERLRLTGNVIDARAQAALHWRFGDRVELDAPP